MERETQRKLKDYEHLLRKFQYREALDAVLSKGDPLLVVSALEELLIRQSLQAALGGRNNQELEPILQFLYKYILNPRYNAHLFMVFHIVLDLYASVLGRAPLVDDLVMRIHLKIENEVKLQRQMFELAGTLELVGFIISYYPFLHKLTIWMW